ncbi:MAG: alkyl sulfatase dimerization domain-containing protein [Acidimicrobiales bacterium]
MTTPDLLELSEQILSGRRGIDDHHPLQIGMAANLQPLSDRVAFVESFANVVATRTDDGLVIVDAGSPMHANAIVEAVRGWTPAPLHTAVFTHGHVDHIYAVRLFEAEGSGPAHVVAHEALPARFRRYEATNGYNGVINQRQFQLPVPLFPGDYRYPDETYATSLDRTVGGVEFSLRHDRGETDDHTWVWMPADKVLCTGDLFIWASPNCGNPQKAQRYCDEWAVALRKMADLGAEFLLPGHGLPIAGAERIRGILVDTAEYLESLFTQTIELMNSGARLDEIIHTVRPPADLVDRPWLQPVYDEPEFVVRNIWRLYGGWYDGNPASLKPAPDAVVATELATLAGGAARLAERALELSEAGDHRLASHLVELASLAEPEAAEIRAARARVFGERAGVERSTMAKGVYSWAHRESAEG